MGEFWSLEGIDGAGKSHLLSQLATQYPHAALVRKDALARAFLRGWMNA